MSWKKLVEIKQKYFFRGDILRCLAKYPYEKIVDFMLINDPQSPSGHTLIVATGYKSGHILICLPEEALPPKSEKVGGILVSWVIKNWNEWIYDDTEVGDVYFSRGHYIRDDGLIGPCPYEDEE
ncbi:MAG: hypothetical protein KA436_11715 [Oligoflexales bacterium]|nr:hypothetical protein [Oligoflexales bacterium]